MCYVAGRQFSHQNRVKLVADSDQQGVGGGGGALIQTLRKEGVSATQKVFPAPRASVWPHRSSKFKVYCETLQSIQG